MFDKLDSYLMMFFAINIILAFIILMISIIIGKKKPGTVIQSEILRKIASFIMELGGWSLMFFLSMLTTNIFIVIIAPISALCTITKVRTDTIEGRKLIQNENDLDFVKDEEVWPFKLKLKATIVMILYVLFTITCNPIAEDIKETIDDCTFDMRLTRIVRLESLMAATPLDEGLEGYQVCEAFDKILVDAKWMYSGILDNDDYTITVKGRTRDNNTKLVYEWKYKNDELDQVKVKYGNKTFKGNDAMDIFVQIMHY